MGARSGKIARPIGHRTLEISFRLKGFNRRGKIPEDRAIQAQDAENNLPDGVAVTRRHRHVTGHSRPGVLAPWGVAADGAHHRSARGPVRRFELIDELDFTEAGGLLHRKRAAVGKATKYPRPAVAVAKLRVEGDDRIEGRFEVGEVCPGQFELDLQAGPGLARRDFDADFLDGVQVAWTKAEAALDIGAFEAG